MKIKKGDNVEVITGNDKGKRGEVIKVIPKENKVIVRGINLRSKSIKPRTQQEQGGIIKVECPINVSKIALVCPKCDKPVRVGYKMVKGEKIRICKKCETPLK